MADHNVPRPARAKYNAPTVTRVQVEAQQELLTTTGCAFGDGTGGTSDCHGSGNGPYNA